MILKQRFAPGKTQIIDIGDNFLIITPANENWGNIIKGDKDVHSVIEFTGHNGHSIYEPLYMDFPQWIYSNDGQLFLTLTYPTVIKSQDTDRQFTRFELQAALFKMDFYNLDKGFMLPVNGEMVFFEDGNLVGSTSITREEIVKMIDES